MRRTSYDLDVGESLRIGSAHVEFQYKSGRKARLSVSVPENTPIEHVKATGRSIGTGPWDRAENVRDPLAKSLAIG